MVEFIPFQISLTIYKQSVQRRHGSHLLTTEACCKKSPRVTSRSSFSAPGLLNHSYNKGSSEPVCSSLSLLPLNLNLSGLGRKERPRLNVNV